MPPGHYWGFKGFGFIGFRVWGLGFRVGEGRGGSVVAFPGFKGLHGVRRAS